MGSNITLYQIQRVYGTEAARAALAKAEGKS